MEGNSQTQTSTWDQIKDDSKRLFKTFEKAVDETANNLSKLILVSLEPEDRQKLEKLVESGLASSVKEAARLMIQEGIKTRADLFTQINKTNMEIQDLKNQLDINFASKQTE
jgi:tyrosyl-tRNA synthetase